MALVKRAEDRPVLDRWGNMERLFDDMWRNTVSRFFRMPSMFDVSDTELFQWQQTADIEETANEYIIRVDLPGMRKDDIHVSLDNNVLTIRGQRQRVGSENQQDYRVLERYYGNFYRSFLLPSTVDENSIDAAYKDGVLTLTVTKREEARARNIEIK